MNALYLLAKFTKCFDLITDLFFQLEPSVGRDTNQH